MNGIENWFVLTNIFGNDFSFIESKVEYLRNEIFAGRISLDFIINCNVKNPPSKWSKWDNVYVKIDFFWSK